MRIQITKAAAVVFLLGAFDATACGGSDASGGAPDGGAADGAASSGSGGDAGIGGDDGGPGGGDDAPSTGDGAAGTAAITTIFTIVLENHDYAEIVAQPDGGGPGATNAPYMNSLIASYGLATNYFDSGVHPSLPNYLYLASGDTQYPGKVDLLPTQRPFPSAGDNLGHQLETAGIPWRSYQEGMTTPCKLVDDGEYAPRHDPFLYFSDMDSGVCAQRNVDYAAEFAKDLAAGTYRYMWITPNLLDDGHDPSKQPTVGLKQSDDWLAKNVPLILQSDAYKNGGAIFITWDEAEGRGSDDKDQVPMIVVSPLLKSPGFKSATKFTHASYLATVEDVFKLPRLNDAKTATSLAEFFR